MNKWIKPLGALIIIILFFSAMSRLLTRGETLLEYADANPEIAYATPKKTTLLSASPSKMPSSEPAGNSAVLPDGDASASVENLPSSSAADASAAAPTQTTGPFVPHTSPDAENSMDIVYYAEGFSYQPLPDEIIRRITGISYPVPEELAPLLSIEAVNIVSGKENLPISYDDLRYLNVLYYDFEGQIQTGELICNQAIASDLAEIFYELYLNEYQIEKICLIDEYGGDDTASMLDNNTSCFNYRLVEGSSNLSKHALGLAIDVNPFYNPYVVFNKNGSGQTYISPEGSEIYADRSQNFPYKIDENDLCYKLFTAHGFIWGGNWNSSKDYQHFQKTPN